MLNLLDVTYQHHVFAMFVIAELQTVFHVEYVGMFMIYFCTKCHMFISNVLLLINMKSKAKESFCKAVTFLFCVLKYYLNKR